MTPSLEVDRGEHGGDTLRIAIVTQHNTASVTLEGEADIASLANLRSALASPELDGAPSVHLHASGLRFCDVATLLELAEFARRSKTSGHVVTTIGAPPMVQKMARIMGVEDDLGLR